MASRRGIRLVLVGVVLAATVLASNVSDASANGNCAAGEFCIWGEDAYTGCYYDHNDNVSNLQLKDWDNCGTVSPNQGTNSFKNLGVSCNTSLWDYMNYTGGTRTALRVGEGGWWADTNLGNNKWGGNVNGSSGTIMENDITSWRWCY